MLWKVGPINENLSVILTIIKLTHFKDIGNCNTQYCLEHPNSLTISTKVLN